MKVDFTSGMNIYKRQGSASAGRDSRAEQTGAACVSELSRGGASGLDKSLLGARVSIQNSLGTQTSQARLDELAQSIRDGSYHVSTDDLVRAILDLDV